MSSVVSMARVVPTLTEVLEQEDLGLLAGPRGGQGPGLEPTLDLDLAENPGVQAAAGRDPQFKQAILALVDTAIEEFRADLLARLEPLLDPVSKQRSE